MDQAAVVGEFCAITNASKSDAQHYLESFQWQLEDALSAYLEAQENKSADLPKPVAPPPNPTPPPSSSNAARPSSSAARSSNTGGIRTFADLNRGNDDDDDSDEPKKEKSSYYAGGSKSGMVVENPDKVVTDLFDKAKSMGAKSIEEHEGEEKESKPFSGAGYTLGSSMNAPILPIIKKEDQKPVKVVMTFWKNGFQVDYGALRSYQDPANTQFLRSVERGEIPQELTRGRQTTLDVHLVDKKGEDYTAPKPVFVPFSSSGQTLGSTSASTATSSSSSSSASSSSKSGSGSGSSNAVSVDESKPTTTLQIRLHDGTRLVAKFNHTHTIQDIRNYIDASQRLGKKYDLMTTFPKKELKDNQQTITEANLLNAVLVQAL